MTPTRYTVSTKGSCTTVHRIGKAVGPIVRGTSFGRPENGARASRRGKKKGPKADD
jgi:hypothetical protein